QATLNNLAKSIAAKLEKVVGVVDVKSGVVEAGPELVARVDQAKAGRAGLTPDVVATQANAAMYGDVVSQILQGDRQIGVRVRYPAGYRTDAAGLALLPIRSPNGFNLPLASLAHFDTVPGTTEITREDQRRMVSIT